ncbi:MAG: YchJ family protein [Schaalia turicensis]
MTFSDVPRKGVASAQGLAPTDPCTCGSGIAFRACCSPILDGEPAPTAEALMRSRYSAFVLGNENHLFRSWHPRTRPAPHTLTRK